MREVSSGVWELNNDYVRYKTLWKLVSRSRHSYRCSKQVLEARFFSSSELRLPSFDTSFANDKPNTFLVPARSLTWRKAHGSLSGLGTRQARKMQSRLVSRSRCSYRCSKQVLEARFFSSGELRLPSFDTSFANNKPNTFFMR